MQRAQSSLHRSSSVSTASVSAWLRLLLIPILLAGVFSSLTDFSAPAPDIHAAPMSSSAHNAGPMKSHAPNLRDESAWFQLKHIGTRRPSANARAVALVKAASLPRSQFGQASQVRNGGKNGTSAQTQVAAAGNAPAPNSGGWTPLGPAPEATGQGVSDSGRITSIAVNPQNSNDIWIGSADGGVWNSLDGGTSWVPMTDGLTDYPVTQNGQTTEVIATLAIGSVAIDPVNPQVIYVGTGEANFSEDNFWGVGILKSTDHGQTWTQYGASQFTGLTVGKIIIDPTNSNTLLAAVSINASSPSSTDGTDGLPTGVSVSQAGIYRSTNGGQTWTQVLGQPMFSYLASATDVIFDPTNHNVVYAGFGQYQSTGTNPTCPCLWESTSNGSPGSWASVSAPGLPGNQVSLSRVSLSISEDGSRFYALFISPSRSDAAKSDIYNSSIYVSDHTAATWTADSVPSTMVNDAGEEQWQYESLVAVDPTNSQTAYLGGVDLYQTTDGGNTWSFASGFSPSLTHTDQHALAFLSNTSSLFYLGNDGGIWEGGSGSIYTDLNGANGAGLNITQLYGASVGLTGPDAQIYAGSQDNGILQYPLGVNGEAQWNGVATGSSNGDGGQVAVDPTNNAIVYAEQSYGEMYRSTSGGSSGSWIQIGGDNVDGLNACAQGTSTSCDFTNFVMPFALAPTNHDELFAGTDKLYRSTNDGQSWSSLGSLDQLDGQIPISALAIGPQSDSVLYVGDNRGEVFASTDGGASWGQNNLSGTAGGMVTGLAIDPINASIVYATIANFAKCPPGVQACGQHIFRSINGGATWTDIAPQSVLPNIPFESVVVDPLDDNTLFVGTDAGIFDTPDALDTPPNGPSWYQVVGLPKVAVEQLFTDSKGTQLYVATHGRGLWRVPLISGAVYTSVTQTLWGNPTTYDRQIIADDALTGARLWTDHAVTAAGNHVVTLQLANSALYAVSSEGSVLCLDTGSGRVLWQVTLPALILAGPATLTVANNVVYVADGKLYALDATTGATLWSVSLAKGKHPPAADHVLVTGNVVYVSTETGASGGMIFALNAATGAPVWSTALGSDDGDLGYGGGVLYVGDAQLVALNATTGAVQWTFQGPPAQPTGQPNAWGAPLVASGVVYASCLYWSEADNSPHQGVWAVDAATGAQQWSFDEGTTGTGGTNVILTNATLFNGGSNLFALTTSSGAEMWGDQLAYNMVGVVDSQGALFTFGNGLFAVNELSGAELWRDTTIENVNNVGTYNSYVVPVVAAS